MLTNNFKKLVIHFLFVLMQVINLG